TADGADAAIRRQQYRRGIRVWQPCSGPQRAGEERIEAFVMIGIGAFRFIQVDAESLREAADLPVLHRPPADTGQMQGQAGQRLVRQRVLQQQIETSQYQGSIVRFAAWSAC